MKKFRKAGLFLILICIIAVVGIFLMRGKEEKKTDDTAKSTVTEKKNRTIHYSFKATPEEDAIIQKKMKMFGIKNQSAFIRAMALNGYVLKLDLPELHEAVRLMGSLSNNVNQIARRLNEGGSILETEIDDIKDRQEELRTILSSILRRLDQIQH